MPRKPKGYSRVESDTQQGWLVRIKRGDLRRSKFISDATHGGKKKSQQVARATYQEWEKELPAPETSQGKLGKRNTSGVVGVHYASDTDSRYTDCVYEYYIASWKTDDGRRAKIRFAFNKWGKKVAFEMACIAREKRTTDVKAIERLHKRRKEATKKPKRAKGTRRTSSARQSKTRR